MLHIRRNAHARVAHVQSHLHAALAIAGHGLGTAVQLDLALRGELDGIAQQVDQDLRQSVAIALDPSRHIRVHAQDVAQGFRFCPALEQLECGVQGFVQVEGLLHHLKSTGLHLGVVQQVVDDGQQVLARFLDVLHFGAHLGVQFLVMLDQVGQTQNGVHRGAQLVADRSHEQVFLLLHMLQFFGQLA